jgi:hypothetical protein
MQRLAKYFLMESGYQKTELFAEILNFWSTASSI